MSKRSNKNNEAGSITIVGGSKGGVGKSFVAMSAIDYLTTRGDDVLLVDSDTSNTDVAKAYANEVKCELINLDESEGWIQLLNVCEANPEKHVVISTAARNNEAVKSYGNMLSTSLAELKRDLTTLWVINRQRDGLELLKAYREAIPNTKLHVVMNGHYGDASKFELYIASNIRKEIEGNGGKSVVFPDLADRVADYIYVQRKSINQASKEMPIGNRAELARWHVLMTAMMAEVLE